MLYGVGRCILTTDNYIRYAGRRRTSAFIDAPNAIMTIGKHPAS